MTVGCASQRSRRRKKKNKVNVVAPQVQQAYGLEPQTAEGQLETSYLLFLGLVFVIIILEGLFIATSVSDCDFAGTTSSHVALGVYRSRLAHMPQQGSRRSSLLPRIAPTNKSGDSMYRSALDQGWEQGRSGV